MGLYVHIPFCRKACHYCDFHFTVNLNGVKPLLQALSIEAQNKAPFWTQQTFDSIYFGGGTPGLLGPRQLEPLLNTLRSNFSIAAEAEITLETNPDDLLEFGAQAWKDLGINRISLGIQSLNTQVLARLNRAHDAKQALQALDKIEAASFQRVSVDLMFGLPGQSREDVLSAARELAHRNVHHISAYGLTVETGTQLELAVRKGKEQLPEEEESAEQFLSLHSVLSEAGFEHYEVSNYARAGQRSRHNSAYWSGEDYLGLGPSAHSLQADKRWFNRSSNGAYVQAMQQNTSIQDLEELSANQKVNEWLMTRMRTLEGAEAEEAVRRVGITQWNIWQDLKSEFPASWFQTDKDLAFTAEGWLMMDSFLRKAIL
jgi:oxygen-independent coproporphyrinogen-3 oxidase